MKLSTSVAITDGSSYEKPPEGKYLLQLVGIHDLGRMPGGQFEPRATVLLRFACFRSRKGDLFASKDSGGNIHTVFARFTPSVDKKAKLRPVIESLLCRKLVDPVIDFELDSLLGKCCWSDVVHTQDGKYANIETFSRLSPDDELPTEKVLPLESWYAESAGPPLPWAQKSLAKSLTLAGRLRDVAATNGHSNGNGAHAPEAANDDDGHDDDDAPY